MAIVQLNISDFRTFYPIFADAVQYPDNVITYAFNLAETYIDNTNGSPIPYDPSKNILLRQRVLYMATCHLLQLNSQSPQQTGAVTSASQGSVSVGYSPLTGNSFASQFWSQTRCGQQVWMMLSPYRLGGRFYTSGNFHPFG